MTTLPIGRWNNDLLETTLRRVLKVRFATIRRFAGHHVETHRAAPNSIWSVTEVGEMHIGLIGGIGPGATDFYYRRLISTFARKNATLELTIVHADTPTLLNNLARNE
jgi:hypothetical protein